MKLTIGDQNEQLISQPGNQFPLAQLVLISIPRSSCIYTHFESGLNFTIVAWSSSIFARVNLKNWKRNKKLFPALNHNRSWPKHIIPCTNTNSQYKYKLVRMWPVCFFKFVLIIHWGLGFRYQFHVHSMDVTMLG